MRTLLRALRSEVAPSVCIALYAWVLLTGLLQTDCDETPELCSVVMNDAPEEGN